jgi:hypothetical protein
LSTVPKPLRAVEVIQRDAGAEGRAFERAVGDVKVA